MHRAGVVGSKVRTTIPSGVGGSGDGLVERPPHRERFATEPEGMPATSAASVPSGEPTVTESVVSPRSTSAIEDQPVEIVGQRVVSAARAQRTARAQRRVTEETAVRRSTATRVVEPELEIRALPLRAQVARAP